jgi:hypothetical protein
MMTTDAPAASLASECYMQRLRAEADRGCESIQAKFAAMVAAPPAPPRFLAVPPRPCSAFCVLRERARSLPPPQQPSSYAPPPSDLRFDVSTRARAASAPPPSGSCRSYS